MSILGANAVNILALKCEHCGSTKHLVAHRRLPVGVIETIAANLYHEGFEQYELDRQVLAWEGEGGR